METILKTLKMDKKIPDVRPGDIVRVYQKIREGKKEREQAFEGVVIKRQGGKMPGASFVVRKISQGIGVERKFPLYSPTLTKIQVKKRSKVKRADLSYLRNVGQIKKKLKDRKIEPFEESLVIGIKEEPATRPQEIEKPQEAEKEKTANTETTKYKPAKGAKDKSVNESKKESKKSKVQISNAK